MKVKKEEMVKRVNSILINETDNVATAIVELQRGDIGLYSINGKEIEVPITEHIPPFHKFAIRNIGKAQTVRKYGEAIGQAILDIEKGSHIHDHNIVSPETGK